MNATFAVTQLAQQQHDAQHAAECLTQGRITLACKAAPLDALSLSSEVATSGSGCDSSDCLFCQYRTGCSHQLLHRSAYAGNKLSSLLRKRSLSNSGASSVAFDVELEQLASGSVGLLQALGAADAAHKRQRVVPPHPLHHAAAELPALNPTGVQLLQPQHDGLTAAGLARCSGSKLHAGRGWRFRAEWSASADPGPATLCDVLSLTGGPAAPGRPSDIICALEFSPDGQLLASGGVVKELRLYGLSDLFSGGLCDATCDSRHDRPAPAGAPRAGAAGAGSSDLLVSVQRLPSKISCVSWSPHADGVLTLGDYDGVLLQLHVGSGHQLADVDHHAGRKIWSVAHSQRVPHLVASAGDDGAARLWAGRGLSECVATLRPNASGKASVCSVDFSAQCDHLLALAASDRCAYLYDTRYLRDPLAVLRHHARPVSYIRFFGAGPGGCQRLVTASTDGSVALWDLPSALAGEGPALAAQQQAAGGCSGPAAVAQQLQRQQHQLLQLGGGCTAAGSPFSSVAGGGGSSSSSGSRSPPWQYALPASTDSGGATPRSSSFSATAASSAGAGAAGGPSLGLPPWRVFRGHRNERNFVGLTVRPEEGLVACGSETSRAYVYHTSWSSPLASADTGLGPGPRQAKAQHHGRGDDGGDGLSRRAHLQGEAGQGLGSHPLLQQRPQQQQQHEGAFVSAVCWQPPQAGALLGLPPLLAMATSHGNISLSALMA